MDIKSLLAKGKAILSAGSSDSDESLSLMGGLIFGLESEVLLAHVLGCRREDLIVNLNEEVSPDDEKLFLKYIADASDGRPISYITHGKEFYGLDFFVDERVLVPRPETEMIVDEVLSYLKSTGCENPEDPENFEKSLFGPDRKILDIGTGSFNIPAAILKNCDGVFAHAVDVSEDAMEVAKINREAHGLETRAEIYWSDLLSQVEDDFFEVITANLPYVVKGTESANVAANEPAAALYGDGDGLDEGSCDGLGLYKKLVQQIVDRGIGFNLMVCEFGIDQADEVTAMLNKFFEQLGWKKGVDADFEIKSDLAGIPRIFVIRKI